jgi:hypothetical protein
MLLKINFVLGKFSDPDLVVVLLAIWTNHAVSTVELRRVGTKLHSSRK